MRGIFTKTAEKQYCALPARIRASFEKQMGFLLGSLSHPSLHAKKYDEQVGLWQARIDRSYRFYFLIQKDMYVVMSIRKHPK